VGDAKKRPRTLPECSDPDPSRWAAREPRTVARVQSGGRNQFRYGPAWLEDSQSRALSLFLPVLASVTITSSSVRSAPLLFAVDPASHSRIQPVMRRRCTSVSTASSARSAARQRIPASAKPQLAAAIRVIVAMASMGRSLIASGPCPQCRRSSKAQGAYDLSHLRVLDRPVSEPEAHRENILTAIGGLIHAFDQ
jgi:hypothetical protein